MFQKFESCPTKCISRGTENQFAAYGLREGDLIALAAIHKPARRPRIENGARGQVTRIDELDRTLTVRLDGSQRELRFAGEELEHLRLAYAQHVYRQQGVTVERAVIVTGGWQTSRETAYVQASRARHGTEWFLAREELGLEGQDDRRVEQLAAKMRRSQARTPSLALRERLAPAWEPGREPLRLRGLPAPTDWLLRRLHRATPDRGVERAR